MDGPVHLEMDMFMTSWNVDCTSTKYSGIFKTKDGYRVRVRAVNPNTGTMKEANQTYDRITIEEALLKQAELKGEIRRGGRELAIERAKYADYAESLLKRKLASNKLATPSSKKAWTDVQDLHLIPKFGDWYLDAIKRIDVEEWKAEQAKLRVARKGHPRRLISPHTVNQRLRVLLATLRAAVAELDLPYDPTRGVEPLDTSAHETFTEEEPNSLLVEELRTFMAHARRLYPQYFAMIALGVATGRRPCELRPLRRNGPTPDIVWDEGLLLIRRSQTLDDVVTKTKTGRKLRIPLPADLVEILRWHVEQLPAGPMRDSELLFPSTEGSWRSPTCLDKPLKAITKAAGIKKHLSAKFMRRTFQDLGRAAEVHDLVVRSISGHATREMQDHYSSVAPTEVRDGLAKVISLAGFREALAVGGDQGGDRKGLKGVGGLTAKKDRVRLRGPAGLTQR